MKKIFSFGWCYIFYDKFCSYELLFFNYIIIKLKGEKDMKKRNLLVKVLILAFVYVLILNMPFNVMASSAGGIISSGTAEREVSILGEGISGDIAWKVDSNGVLWLTGNGDYAFDDGYHKHLPWHDYSKNITSAVVNISGITNTAYMFSDCSNLTNLDVSNFDTSKVTDMWYMFNGCSNLESLDVSSFDTSKVTSMGYMFSGCSKLESLDVSNFDTSNTTNIMGMFRDCTNLKSLDVSNFNTSKIIYMYFMFSGCNNLISLDVSNFDTSNVIEIRDMFYSCSKLTSLDVKNFDTSKITDMQGMFYGCSNLENLDVSNFDTSNVTNIEFMFNGCSKLESLDVKNFNTSKVTNMWGMFSGCNNLISLDVSNFNTSNVTDMRSMFQDCTNLKILDLSNFDTSNVIYMDRMFNNCTNLTSLDVSSFDTSNVTDIHGMFSYCTNLTSLDVSNFNTSKVYNMNDMFIGCSNLTSLDVSNFDTSNVTDIGFMFRDCTNLTSVNLSNFDTSKITDMKLMFRECTNLTSLDLSNFDTSNVTSMEQMFSGCANLTNLNISNFDTSNVTDMGFMFSGCANLISLDLSNFDTSNVTSMERMFRDCANLTNLNISNFDTSNVTDMSRMFYSCNSLMKLYTPINVTALVELPSSDNETWYMDTTEITHLPQNLNYSVLLVKEISASDPETPDNDKVLVEAITISPSNISLKAGEKRTLSKSCTPSNASRQSVSWHSTDSDIASVDNQGTVTGVSEGTTEIYCVSEDGGNIESNRCTVEVTANSDITATKIPNKAMKYVPYSYMLQNSSQLSRNTSNYQLKSGSLPEGMDIKSDGELYGVPEQTGTFTFTVEIDNNDSTDNSNNTLSLREQTFTLQVIENTNANIEAMTDPGYELTQRVPNLTLDTLTDQTMVSKGDYEEFVNLFLDGVKLEREVDYTAEPGSTRITIKSQTLKRFNTPGTHTLAMEFRTKRNNTLRWAAQNYVISGNGNSNTSNNKVSLRGRGSRRGSSSSQTAAVSDIIYDSKKGYVHIVTGIITGEGTGYSRWIQDETGWKLNYADRTLARGSIQQLEDGTMIEQILWELINGAWYAFGADGSVKDGWVYDYQLGSWYCTSAESGMKVSWHTDSDDGHTYYLEPETGKLARGWKQINNQWYYFNTDTTSQGWRFDETTGNWNYNANNKEKPFGAMYKNEQTPDGYYVNGDGIWN